MGSVRSSAEFPDLMACHGATALLGLRVQGLSASIKSARVVGEARVLRPCADG